MKFLVKFTVFVAFSIAITSASRCQTIVEFSTPPKEPKLFYENFVSTNLNERDFALSPDGTEMYFTVSTPQSTFQTIVFSKKNKKGIWSKPEVVSFAGKYSDLEPAFNPDGNKIYFASNRPLKGSDPKDFDIWAVERNGLVWSEPKNLGATINTDSDEFYPSITKSGNLYFTAQYSNGIGKEDIFVAKWATDRFEKPIALDTAINTRGYEFNAFVDANETLILFTAYGRKEDTGRGDLYMSVKDGNGKWTDAKNLKSINSDKLDYCPFVSADKKVLFFTSERADLPVSFTTATSYEDIKKLSEGILNNSGNIYWVDFEVVLKSIKN